MKKFQFKTIDVDIDTGEVQYRDPQLFNLHSRSPRKEAIRAWNEECRLREAELEIYNNEIHNSRDELVQTPDTETGT